MEGKVAVLGGSDFVMAFKALGLDGFAVETKTEEVQTAAREILKKKYGLVVVAENIAAMTEEVFEPVQKKPTPSIVVVPFLSESSGYAIQSLGQALKLATGINILDT